MPVMPGPALPAFVCHPSARRRLRHTHHPGAAGPQRRRHHHDLHARLEPRRAGRAEPPGCPSL